MIVASIDIGTNTVLLLIAKKESGTKLTALLNKYSIPRIGKGLTAGGQIQIGKVQELLNVLTEYERLIRRYGCEKIIVTATNAFRIASNRKEIEKIIFEQFGWKVNTVSGETEAELSYLGAITDYVTNEELLVIDIGGGSTELTFGNNKEMKFRKSFHIGAVNGTEMFLKNEPPGIQEIKKFENHLSKLFNELKNSYFTPQKIIAISGTPATLACMNQGLTEYNEEMIEGTLLEFNTILRLKESLSNLSSAEIIETYQSVVKGREDIIFCGTLILLNILKKLNSPSIIVSTKGIRHGAIIKENI